MNTAAKITGMAMMVTSMRNAMNRRASTPSNNSGLTAGS